ncbi:MAG: DUF4249 domain-containing protein [Chitinophagaceae bacterium]|nr:DUF4249 domain-containing protein [Chitinophagaceae bacterium]
MKFLYLIALIFLISCERTISFTPENQEPKLVVEGIVEQNEHPTVVLTTSLDFFSHISREKLTGSFVRGAEITISDGTTTELLKEYEVPVAGDTVLYYYSVDTSNGRVGMHGEPGKSYNLTIKSGGKEYTAFTTIPIPAKTLDSLYYYQAVNPEDEGKVILYGRFNDPPGLGNYVRYFTNVNGGLYLPGLNSVYDDQIVDGTKYNVQIERGVDRNLEIDFEEYAYFSRGDIISVKFCNIDKAVFDFWRTMEYSYASIGNPFSSPTKVVGNISNGALGYFGGYSVQYASVIIPE